MSYADRGGWNRQKVFNATASLLIQGAVVYALVTGLTVVIKPQPDKPLVAEQIDAITPLPPPPPVPPKPLPSQKDSPPPLIKPAVDLAPLPLPSPAPTLMPPTGSASPAETPAPSPTVTASASPAFSATPARARNDPRSWASTSDYPAREQAEGHEGTVRFELSIGADGRPVDCRIVSSSGFAGLDTVTCNLIMRRARFDPARDDSGAKVAGRYSGAIRWQIPKD